MSSAGVDAGRTPRRPVDLPPPGRLPLLLLGLAALVAGLGAGLARLGWTPAFAFAVQVPHHGPLMVGGFLGTLIALERAVAFARLPGYAGPLLSGTGAAALLVGADPALGAALTTGGSAVLFALSLHFHRLQRTLANLTVAAGAAAWLAGNVLWLAGLPVAAAVPWWLLFALLTVAGERLELSRYLPVPAWARRLFLAALALLFAGTLLLPFAARAGEAVTALGLFAVLAWLLRFDIARKTVRKAGLPRYCAVAIFNGYAWLAVAAAAWLAEAVGLGAARDTLLHAIFLGFVFSMVFAHAPIVFPAVTGLSMPFHPLFYLAPALLDVSLLLRFGGTLAGAHTPVVAGGLGHLVAIVAFVACLAASIVAGRRAGLASR